MTDQTSDSFSVAIAGVAGRMGRQLAAVSHRHGLTVAGGTEIAGSPHLDTDIGDLASIPNLGVKPASDPVAAAAKADVWFDFTRPAATIAALERGEETSKPGWVRLNLSALMSDSKADMIINAVDELARIAPEYLSRYHVESSTARFKASNSLKNLVPS